MAEKNKGEGKEVVKNLSAQRRHLPEERKVDNG